jgi:hypothetical protein
MSRHKSTFTHRYPLKHVAAWLLFIAATLFAIYVILGQASALLTNDDNPKNYQDYCTGQETSGHCADKCPDQTGILLGFDPVTKVAQCKSADKPVTTTSQNTPDTELPQFVDNTVDSGENFVGK